MASMAGRGARPQAPAPFRPQAANELRTITVDQLAEMMREALGGPSATGINVTTERALQTAAWWVTCTVLAESVAQLPRNVHKLRAGGEGSDLAPETPVHRMLSKRGRPNDWQTAFRFWHLLVWHIVNRGNFYAFKNYAGGTLRELLPIHPNRVRVEQDDNFRVTYKVRRPTGGEATFTRAQIFHVTGPTDDGVCGLNPVQYHGEPIGLAVAQDRWAGKLFANGARLSMVLERPADAPKLDEPARERLKAQFTDLYSGVENAHKVPLLEEGMSAKTVGQTGEDSQLLDSRKLQRSIVAALRRVPPHMVGDLDKASFANIENLARQFVDFTLMPWLEMLEPEVDLQLMTEAERAAGLYFKFNVRGLLRGDARARADFYSKMVQIRAMNPNEVRADEDLNPYDGGDEFINPNIQSTDDPEARPEDRPDETAEERRARLAIVGGGQ